jgi:ubiquinone biosynthesis protein
MDVTELAQFVRNTSRFSEVVSIMAKYGLVGWLRNIRLDWVQRLFLDTEGKQISDLTLEARLRMALVELGPTYIKLGQILSTRPDLVGSELAEELAELRTQTPADPPQVVRATLEAELGQPVETLFAAFDVNAMASASIGQAHCARLPDGREVVVKLQHAGIEERIQNDLEILIKLAQLAEEYAPQLRQYQPVATATEFRRTLLNELDFRREQRNLQRFRRNFRHDNGVCFPKPHDELCSRRVLTMELLSGIHVSDTACLQSAGLDLDTVARRGAHVFLDMIFRDGFYHADPHPGNLIVMDDARIGILDCGMVGWIDADLRDDIEAMLLAMLEQDAQALTDIVVRIGSAPMDVDRDELCAELETFVTEYSHQSLQTFDLNGALSALIAIIRRHHIILPTKLAMLLKVLIMLDGTARQLSPTFNLTELLQPYSAQIIERRLSPARFWRRLESTYRDWHQLMEILPRDLADILHRVKLGSFQVHLDHRRLDSIVNRLVMGILTAALFMGSASLWSQNVPPIIGGVSLPGVTGYLVSMYLGWLLLRAIKRSGDIDDRD